MLISMLIEQILADQHCVIVGPFDRLSAAMEAAQTATIDLAVLDVNLAGTKVYPLAEALSRRGIPFLLLSGYGQAAVPPDHPDWHVCSKPFRPAVLVSMLRDQLSASRWRPAAS